MSEKDYGDLGNLFCTMQFLIAYWYVFISKFIEIFICYLKLYENFISRNKNDNQFLY